MNKICITIIILLVFFISYIITCKSASGNSVLGAYIDLASGSHHIISPGMVNIDGELHWLSDPKIAQSYNFKDMTYKGSPLVPAEQYNAMYIESIINHLSGRYKMGENATVFINIKNERVTGFLWFETGEEYILEGKVVIKNIYLISIEGTATLIQASQSNVEYELEYGDATFQIDVNADEIVFTSNHDGYIQSYNLIN